MRLTQGDLWELDRSIEVAMDAMNLPPGDADVTQAIGRRAATRGVFVRCLLQQPDLLLSRRAYEPPRRGLQWPGWSGISKTIRERSLPSRTTATFLTTLRAGFWSSTAEKVFPGKEIIPRGWNRKRNVLRQEEKAASARQKTLARELEWIRMSPQGEAEQK